MLFSEQVEAARGHVAALSCGYCPNRQTLERRLELHPVELVVVVPRSHEGRAGRRTSRRLVGWPGQSQVEGTLTWRCPRDHTFPITSQRLLEAFLAAFADNRRRRIVAGVDV
jgi:hypothetical protein